jgi:hypothetical protein
VLIQRGGDWAERTRSSSVFIGKTHRDESPSSPKDPSCGGLRQFDSILEHQIAANMMPARTLMIANVPPPPDVYRELMRQAVSSDQTTAHLMAAILTRAAGKQPNCNMRCSGTVLLIASGMS